MAKEQSPAFQFYPRDFLSDPNVMAMDNAAIGAYVKLMCTCWLQGSIPADPEYLADVVGATPKAFERMWSKLERCFEQNGNTDRLVHPRLEKEREKQAEWREKKAAAGRASGKARKRKGKGGK